MALIRLDRYLADLGVGTRREIKDIIKSGRVTLDGRAAPPDTKLDPDRQSVALDGEALSYSRFRYFMLCKPCGLVTATRDKKQPAVLDLFPPEFRRLGLFPVGRLDKDTSGLLLVTNDGDFAHRVISPKYEVEKLYYAEVEGRLVPDDAAAFEKGIVLADGTRCLPARLDILSEQSCFAAVKEGKYHQVRRMLAARGHRVVTLKRLSVGGLKLDEGMAEGAFRELDQKEIALVFIAISQKKACD